MWQQLSHFEKIVFHYLIHSFICLKIYLRNLEIKELIKIGYQNSEQYKTVYSSVNLYDINQFFKDVDVLISPLNAVFDSGVLG